MSVNHALCELARQQSVAALYEAHWSSTPYTQLFYLRAQRGGITWFYP